MRNYEFTTKKGELLRRISKAQACKLFLQGETITICPCNINPVHPVAPAYDFRRDYYEKFVIDEIGMHNYFNDYILSYEYYNCKNSETGNYTAFYRHVQ